MSTPTWQLKYPIIPLWRSPGNLQLGDFAPLLLEGVPEELAYAVTLLQTPHSRTALGRLLGGLDAHWIDLLINELNQAGMLRQGSRPHFARIQILGNGELAEAMRRALNRIGLNSWITPKLENPSAAFSVIAAPTFEPDRYLSDQLLASSSPFLVVRVHPGRARVGPLVIPGVTSCLRCHDLLRRHHDKLWPLLLAQLCQKRANVQPYLVAWATALSAIQVQAYIDDTEPDTLGRVLQIDAKDHALRNTDVPIHPECGCFDFDRSLLRPQTLDRFVP